MPSKSKTDALREEGTLNAHPEAVTDPLFRDSDFFDPHDVVQVKYEMLRRVRVEGRTATVAAADFGFSRPTFYEARAAFDERGMAGLAPQKRGPRGPHKLRDDVLAFARTRVVPGEPLRAPDLARAIEERFGLAIHPRTLERALRPREKKRS